MVDSHHIADTSQRKKLTDAVVLWAEDLGCNLLFVAPETLDDYL
jgi:hypothetical protein